MTPVSGVSSSLDLDATRDVNGGALLDWSPDLPPGLDPRPPPGPDPRPPPWTGAPTSPWTGTNEGCVEAYGEGQGRVPGSVQEWHRGGRSDSQWRKSVKSNRQSGVKASSRSCHFDDSRVKTPLPGCARNPDRATTPHGGSSHDPYGYTPYTETPLHQEPWRPVEGRRTESRTPEEPGYGESSLSVGRYW